MRVTSSMSLCLNRSWEGGGPNLALASCKEHLSSCLSEIPDRPVVCLSVITKDVS